MNVGFIHRISKTCHKRKLYVYLWHHPIKDSYMDELIFMVKESDEGGYEASALGHAIFTEADSWEELKENVKDAVVCHFDDQSGMIIRLHFVKDEVVFV